MTLVIPHTELVLVNGLRLLVHEDRSSPVVAVNLWYHVGSKDERPGRTGFAHLFEHLMFEGSANAPPGTFDRLLEAAGGVNNGSTTPDRTNYWETVPPGALELALWLESDRMGWLSMTQETLDAQRAVVMNERRQSYENRPYGLAFETLMAGLFPPDHPYHWPTIGSMADLAAATLKDVHGFFRTYYAPSNASLAVAGDIETGEVEKLVEAAFGAIPRGPEVPDVSPPGVSLEGERRLVLEDRVRLPRLYMAWLSPAQYSPGDAALEAVGDVLAQGKASRLYRSLVYQKQIAQDVSAFQEGGLLSSIFLVIVTARPDVPLGRLEDEVRETLSGLVEDGVESHELERARNHIQTSFVDALEHVGGFGGKADRLNQYAYFTGDAGYAERDLARFLELAPEELGDAVAEHVTGGPGVVLSVVPEGRRDLAAGEAA